MTTAVVTVGADSPVRQAAERMATQGFTLLPVLAPDHKLVGVVGETDVHRGRVLHDPRASGPDEGSVPARAIREVMPRDVRTVTPWTDVADAVVVMIDRGLRSLPVVHEGRLVGIVTRRDVARVLAGSDEELRAAVSAGSTPTPAGTAGRCTRPRAWPFCAMRRTTRCSSTSPPSSPPRSPAPCTSRRTAATPARNMVPSPDLPPRDPRGSGGTLVPARMQGATTASW